MTQKNGRTRLELIAGKGTPVPSRPVARRPRTIGVVSGKGGVGKTHIAANLGLALAEHGDPVLVADGDFALGKLDLVIGEQARFNWSHVLSGACSPAQAVTCGPRDVGFLTGAFGQEELAVLDAVQRRHVRHALLSLGTAYRWIVLDLATGLGPNTLELARHVDDLLLLTTPDPSAYSDAYALARALEGRGAPCPSLVVNRTTGAGQGREVAERLERAAERHGGPALDYAGHLPEDPAVQRAERTQKPFVIAAPMAPVTHRVQELAWRLEQRRAPRAGDEALVRAANHAVPEPVERTALVGGAGA